MNRVEGAAFARQAKAAKQPPLPERFWSKVDVRSEDECWPWTAAVRRKDEGYGAFYYLGRHIPAGRMALILSGVEIPTPYEVCHHCDNPSCCNPKHLFVGTRQENNADKVRKGRQARGHRTNTAILTESKVLEIRSIVADRRLENPRKIGARQLCEEYGITVATFNDVIYRRSWRHI